MKKNWRQIIGNKELEMNVWHSGNKSTRAMTKKTATHNDDHKFRMYKWQKMAKDDSAKMKQWWRTGDKEMTAM